jgi:hypothetical protein
MTRDQEMMGIGVVWTELGGRGAPETVQQVVDEARKLSAWARQSVEDAQAAMRRYSRALGQIAGAAALDGSPEPYVVADRVVDVLRQRQQEIRDLQARVRSLEGQVERQRQMILKMKGGG